MQHFAVSINCIVQILSSLERSDALRPFNPDVFCLSREEGSPKEPVNGWPYDAFLLFKDDYVISYSIFQSNSNRITLIPSLMWDFIFGESVHKALETVLLQTRRYDQSLHQRLTPIVYKDRVISSSEWSSWTLPSHHHYQSG